MMVFLWCSATIFIYREPSMETVVVPQLGENIRTYTRTGFQEFMFWRASRGNRLVKIWVLSKPKLAWCLVFWGLLSYVWAMASWVSSNTIIASLHKVVMKLCLLYKNYPRGRSFISPFDYGNTTFCFSFTNSSINYCSGHLCKDTSLIRTLDQLPLPHRQKVLFAPWNEDAP